ncbi:hypothetical protein HBA_0849 [Sodalis endosymbiont of Henestaris halophilus]|nr:hypothetical protein HBA_0849 [Sodalis endosymbiont of Henestaris halophilus]
MLFITYSLMYLFGILKDSAIHLCLVILLIYNLIGFHQIL